MIKISPEAEKLIQKYYKVAKNFIIPDYGKLIYHAGYIAYRLSTQEVIDYNHPILYQNLSKQQVKDLEKECGILFPPSFFEFILITGQNWTDIIYSETSVGQARNLADLQIIPNEFILDEECYSKYPDNIFIIYTEYAGQQIIYFKRDELYAEDPPIYYGAIDFFDGETESYLEKSWGSFSKWSDEIYRHLLAERLSFRHRQ